MDMLSEWLNPAPVPESDLSDKDKLLAGLGNAKTLHDVIKAGVDYDFLWRLVWHPKLQNRVWSELAPAIPKNPRWLDALFLITSAQPYSQERASFLAPMFEDMALYRDTPELWAVVVRHAQNPMAMFIRTHHEPSVLESASSHLMLAYLGVPDNPFEMDSPWRQQRGELWHKIQRVPNWLIVEALDRWKLSPYMVSLAEHFYAACMIDGQLKGRRPQK